MKKLSAPKTSLYKITLQVEDVIVERVVEAVSDKEAVAYMASLTITAEPYSVDRLVAYIQAGGTPIKVPERQKRAYRKPVRAAKTIAAVTVSRETTHDDEPAALAA